MINQLFLTLFTSLFFIESSNKILAASQNNFKTLKPLFAEVSINKSTSKSFCNCSPCSLVIKRDSSKSALLPITNTLTSGLEFALKSLIHKSISSKLLGLYLYI